MLQLNRRKCVYFPKFATRLAYVVINILSTFSIRPDFSDFSSLINFESDEITLGSNEIAFETGQKFTISILVVVGFYVRYLEVKYLNVNYFHLSQLKIYNRCCLLFSILMMLGLSILSTFQATKIPAVHVSAASCFYFSGVANYFAQVIISRAVPLSVQATTFKISQRKIHPMLYVLDNDLILYGACCLQLDTL